MIIKSAPETPVLLPSQFVRQYCVNALGGCVSKGSTVSQGSTDGYAPNLGASAFFIAVFALSSIAFLIQGFRWRGWWGFTVAVTLGTALEAIGSSTRVIQTLLALDTQLVNRLYCKGPPVARPIL